MFNAKLIWFENILLLFLHILSSHILYSLGQAQALKNSNSVRFLPFDLDRDLVKKKKKKSTGGICQVVKLKKHFQIQVIIKFRYPKIHKTGSLRSGKLVVYGSSPHNKPSAHSQLLKGLNATPFSAHQVSTREGKKTCPGGCKEKISEKSCLSYPGELTGRRNQ